MKYLLALALVLFGLSSCDFDRIIDAHSDKKEDLRDKDEKDRDDYDKDDRDERDGKDVDYADLPDAIKRQIARMFPDAEIEEAEWEDGYYIIELDNGVTLYFTKDGRLVKRERDRDDRGDDRDRDRDDRDKDRDDSDEDDDDDDDEEDNDGDDRDSDRNSDR